MRIGLIHYTEDYHKIVEHTARTCYQSYGKLSPDSHTFIRSIMSKGHLSIASVGNIVFGVTGFSGLDEVSNILMDLMKMKEINNFIRWTLPDAVKNPDTNIGTIVSMNILTFLDIYHQRKDYSFNTKLFDSMVSLIDKIPELRWFYDKDTEVNPVENKYTAKGEPELYNPILLTEDYTVLKDKGLTEYELDIHSTITMNLMLDRSSGLQMWRHADGVGGCELSQRYVTLGEDNYRKMVGFNKEDVPELKEGFIKEDWENMVEKVFGTTEEAIKNYEHIYQSLMDMGVRRGRAREIARSILPNAMTTKSIQCRPLRQWKHLFKLRDSNHAQKEITEDVRAIKSVLTEQGIPVEDI